MAWVAVAIGGAALIGGATSLIASGNAADAATSAANTQSAAADRGAQAQADAAKYAADLQAKQFEETRGDFSPWREYGVAALGRQGDLLGLNGADARNNAFANFRADPGYQYTMDQAIQGVDRSAAARGLTKSGAVIKAIQDRASNLADQGYNNYFNRFGVLAGTGQTATNSTATAGANAATNEGNAIIGGANARASGYNTAANAQATGAYNAANAFTSGASGLVGSLNSGLNNYFAYGGGGGGGYGTPSGQSSGAEFGWT